MEKYSIRELIEQAIQTEKLGYVFYTRMADRFAEKTELKNLFENLAVREHVHEIRFSELSDRIKDDEEPEGWEEVSPYLRAVVESEFFLGKDKSLKKSDYVKTAQEAVTLALGFEKETLLYFYALRDSLRDKEIIDEIINEERSHIIWLSNFK